MPDGLNITYIQEETTASDLVQLDEGFYSLSNTPASPPASGDYHYFVSPVGNSIVFKLLEANGIAIDTSGLNYTGSDLLEYLSKLDQAVNNNAAGGGGDPTTASTVEATGAVMNSDFVSNGLMRRTGQDSYDVVTNGIDGLTSSEVDQLKNNDGQPVSTTQWGYVSGLDQNLDTSANVSFNTVNNLSLAEQSSAFTVAGGSSNQKTLTVDETVALSSKLTQVQDDPTPTLADNLNLNGNALEDTNNNKITGFTATGGAVNNLGIANAATGNTPEFYVEGLDADIGVNIASKGNGSLQFNGTGITQNQWSNYLATTDQPVATTSDVNFNTVDVADLATTKTNLNLDNVPNEDATNPYNLDQKGAADGQVLTWDSGNGRWQPGASGSGSAVKLDLADDGNLQSNDLKEIATTNDSNSIFANPTGDKLLIDASKNWPKADDVPDAAVDHDLTNNYNSNEHVDHTSVSIRAGSALTGGGDISSSRTLGVDLTGLTSNTSAASGDEVLINDANAGANKRITVSNFSDSLSLGEGQIKQNPSVINAGQSPYMIPSDVTFVSCETNTGTITVLAQAAGTYPQNSLIAISDKDGNAATNAISIKDSSGTTLAEINVNNGIKYIIDTGTNVIAL